MPGSHVIHYLVRKLGPFTLQSQLNFQGCSTHGFAFRIFTHLPWNGPLRDAMPARRQDTPVSEQSRPGRVVSRSSHAEALETWDHMTWDHFVVRYFMELYSISWGKF